MDLDKLEAHSYNLQNGPLIRELIKRVRVAEARDEADTDAVAHLVDKSLERAHENERMQDRLKLVEAALRFYADERNWRRDFYPEVGASLPGSALVDVDHGDRAREALEGKK